MKDLSVFFDKDKFIRVNTRLGNSQNLNYDEKFPILISRKSNFLYFLFEQIHRDTGNGNEMNLIRIWKFPFLKFSKIMKLSYISKMIL